MKPNRIALLTEIPTCSYTFFVALCLCLFAVNSAQARVNIDIMTNPQTAPVHQGPILEEPEDDPPEWPQLSSAQSAIVIDQETGEMLAFVGPDVRRPMASTTKIMTALLVLENIASGSLDLNTLVTVSSYAGTMGDQGMGKRSEGSIMGDLGDFASDPGQDMSVGLSPGDTVSIQDLLYGLLLDSGNDAALALAEAVSGSEDLFVAQMNTRAMQLGMSNTWYANPHGRDPSRISNCPIVAYQKIPCAHYSTARDIATLTRVALNMPLFSFIVSRQSYQSTTWSARFSGAVDGSMDTSNNFLRRSSRFFKPNVFGVKTGTTSRAGRCLVSAADSLNNSYSSVIAVVLGASGADDDAADRYTDSELMLDYGLRVLERRAPPYIPTHVIEGLK